MSCRLDELRKRCRKLWLRKVVPILLVLIGGGGVLLYSLKDFKPLAQEAPKKELAHSIPKKSVSSQKASHSKQEKVARKCFSLQLSYVPHKGESSRRWLEKFQQRLQKLGFVCHIRQEGSYLALLCDTKRHRADLRPSIAKAKRNGFDYHIRSDECRYEVNISTRSKEAVEPKQLVQPTPPQTKNSILRTETFDPQKAERLFSKRKSFDVAIGLAKHYLARKDYDKALLWARRANALDKENEESWILYAKSLYFLGKKEKAKQVLAIYLEYRESEKVKDLLKRWR